MKLNLSNRIILLTSIIVVIVAIGTGYTGLKMSTDATIKQTEEALLMAAENGVDLIEAVMEKELMTFEEMAARERVQSMDWEIQKEALEQDVERLGYIDIGVMTPDGKTRYILDEDEIAILGDRTYTQKALKGESNVSDVLISRVTNQPVFMYAVPIKSEDEILGVLLGRKDAAAFSNITNQMGYGEGGYAFILNNDGTTYAHPDAERVLNQENLLTATEEDGDLVNVGKAFSELGMGNAGVINYEFSGGRRYMGVAPLRSTEWVLAIGAIESEVLGHINSLKTSIFIGFVVFLLLGIGASLYMGRSISRPIVSLSEILERLADYDLSYDETSEAAKYLERHDEIGDIANSIAKMQKNLIELIEDISEKGEQVVASAEELMATSHESSMSAEEIAQAIEDIAQGASEQASDTEKGATIVGELGEQIVENLQELELLNKVINQILELKDEGLETVKTLVEKTEESAAAASEIHENILHTNESAVQIGNAAKMVESIANQTNLLALNAAIEAARAGEAGRGFAVVADEIRKLAEESNMFTKEIHKVIQELMEKTAAGVETMESVGAIVRAQNESVDMTNNQFNGIAKAIENMQNSLEDFNKSMDKIETSKDGTLNVIQNLSAIAQENAAGTEEASASVEEQTAATEQILDASSALAELTEEMQEAIGRFKF